MKNKFLLVLLSFFICSSIFAVDNTTQIAVEMAQKEIKSLNKDKKSLISKIEDVKEDLTDATEKMAKNQDKPDSRAYKRAVKKSEAAQKKLNELEASLNEVSARIETLLQVCTTTHSDDVYSRSSDLASKTNESETILQTSADLEKNEGHTESSTSYLIGSASKAEKTLENDAQNDSSNEKSNSKKDDTDGYLGVVMILGFIAVIIFTVIADFRRKYRCPKCGKWFDMESLGDTRTREIDEYSGKTKRRGVRKNKRCNSCGERISYVSWF